jgi:RecA-family ATPase
MSGSTAWNNSVRSRLYLEAPKADDGGNAAPDIRTLTVKKANYGPSGVEYRLRYSVGAFVNEDLGAMAGLDKQVAADRIEQQFLDLLDAFTAQGRHVSHNPGHSYAPTKFAQDPAAKGTTAKGFAAAMSRHFAANRIRVGTTGPQSRQVKFIERVPED